MSLGTLGRALALGGAGVPVMCALTVCTALGSAGGQPLGVLQVARAAILLPGEP